MPRDVSWSKEISLPVGGSNFTQDIKDVRIRGVYAGKPAPDFEAATLDGKPFRLSALRGKVVLLDFWATWCAPCVAELPNVKKAHDTFAKQGLVVVGVSFDQSASKARDYVADKQLAWPQVWAEKADKGPIAELYGVSAIPAVFLIGPDGVVAATDLHGDKLIDTIKIEIQKLKSAKPAGTVE